MKFLVTSKVRAGRQPLEGLSSALAQAAWEHGERTLKSGVADCIYSFADGGGSCAIINADSDEALAKILKEIPIYHLDEWQARPLAELGEAMSKLVELLKSRGL